MLKKIEIEGSFLAEVQRLIFGAIKKHLCEFNYIEIVDYHSMVISMIKILVSRGFIAILKVRGEADL